MLERELSAFRSSHPHSSAVDSTAAALRIHSSADGELARVLRLAIDRDEAVTAFGAENTSASEGEADRRVFRV